MFWSVSSCVLVHPFLLIKKYIWTFELFFWKEPRHCQVCALRGLIPLHRCVYLPEVPSQQSENTRWGCWGQSNWQTFAMAYGWTCEKNRLRWEKMVKSFLELEQVSDAMKGLGQGAVGTRTLKLINLEIVSKVFWNNGWFFTIWQDMWVKNNTMNYVQRPYATPTFMSRLRDAGYTTMMAGKDHLSLEVRPKRIVLFGSSLKPWFVVADTASYTLLLLPGRIREQQS